MSASGPDPRAPRLAPVEEWDTDVAATLAKTIERDGTPLNVFTTLAHNPRLLKRVNVLGGLFLTRSSLPPRDRELVILRVGARSLCDYEFGHHVLIGRQAGLTDDEIEAVAAVGDERDWPTADAELLAFTDELLDQCSLGDETWEQLYLRFQPDQLVELVALVGFYRMLCGVLNTCGVQREAGVPGLPVVAVESEQRRH